MRKAITTIIAAAALVAGVTGPAAAADDLAAWRGGFPPASAIGASLGTYSQAPEVTAEMFKGRWYVCADLQARPTTGIATATYVTTPITQSGVRADARVYASRGAAKAAFTAITSRLSRCAGSGVEESEPGSGMKWVVTTSVGKVPAVPGDGKGSLFVYEREKPAKGSKATQQQLGSSFSVLTLVGDTILVSDATVSGAASLSKAQRDAVAAFAGAFVQSWSAANG